MKRADALKALDEAFADGLKRLFAGLVTNLETGTPDAIGKFRHGVGFHEQAHAAAAGLIETIFKD